jgi:hypothetical protein
MQPAGRLVLEFPVYGMAVLSDNTIAVGGGGGRMKSGIPNGVAVYSFDPRTATFASAAPHLASLDAPVSLAGTPASSSVHTVVGPGVKSYAYDAVAKSLQPESPFEHDIRVASKQEQSAVCVSADASVLAIASDAGPVLALSMPDCSPLSKFELHGKGVNDIDITADGARVVSTSARDLTAYIWDAKTGRPVQRIAPVQHVDMKTHVRAVRFSPENPNILFTAESNPRKGAWIAVLSSRYEPIANVKATVDAITALAVHADGRIAVSSSEGHVALFRWKGGTRIISVWSSEQRIDWLRPPPPPHVLPVTAMAFTESGSHFLTASADFTVAAWPAHRPPRIRAAITIFARLLCFAVLLVALLIAENHELNPTVALFRSVAFPEPHASQARSTIRPLIEVQAVNLQKHVFAARQVAEPVVRVSIEHLRPFLDELHSYAKPALHRARDDAAKLQSAVGLLDKLRRQVKQSLVRVADAVRKSGKSLWASALLSRNYLVPMEASVPREDSQLDVLQESPSVAEELSVDSSYLKQTGSEPQTSSPRGSASVPARVSLVVPDSAAAPESPRATLYLSPASASSENPPVGESIGVQSADTVRNVEQTPDTLPNLNANQILTLSSPGEFAYKPSFIIEDVASFGNRKITNRRQGGITAKVEGNMDASVVLSGVTNPIFHQTQAEESSISTQLLDEDLDDGTVGAVDLAKGACEEDSFDTMTGTGAEQFEDNLLRNPMRERFPDGIVSAFDTVRVELPDDIVSDDALGPTIEAPATDTSDTLTGLDELPADGDSRSTDAAIWPRNSVELDTKKSRLITAPESHDDRKARISYSDLKSASGHESPAPAFLSNVPGLDSIVTDPSAFSGTHDELKEQLEMDMPANHNTLEPSSEQREKSGAGSAAYHEILDESIVDHVAPHEDGSEKKTFHDGNVRSGDVTARAQFSSENTSASIETGEDRIGVDVVVRNSVEEGDLVADELPFVVPSTYEISDSDSDDTVQFLPEVVSEGQNDVHFSRPASADIDGNVVNTVSVQSSSSAEIEDGSVAKAVEQGSTPASDVAVSDSDVKNENPSRVKEDDVKSGQGIEASIVDEHNNNAAVSSPNDATYMSSTDSKELSVPSAGEKTQQDSTTSELTLRNSADDPAYVHFPKDDGRVSDLLSISENLDDGLELAAREMRMNYNVDNDWIVLGTSMTQNEGNLEDAKIKECCVDTDKVDAEETASSSDEADPLIRQDMDAAVNPLDLTAIDETAADDNCGKDEGVHTQNQNVSDVTEVLTGTDNVSHSRQQVSYLSKGTGTLGPISAVSDDDAPGVKSGMDVQVSAHERDRNDVDHGHQREEWQADAHQVAPKGISDGTAPSRAYLPGLSDEKVQIPINASLPRTDKIESTLVSQRDTADNGPVDDNNDEIDGDSEDNEDTVLLTDSARYQVQAGT